MVFLAELVDSCDVNLIKSMVISVCSLNKKRSSSSDSRWSVIEKQFEISPNSDDIERQFKELFLDIDEPEELLMIKSDAKSKTEPTTTIQNRPHYLSIYTRNKMHRKTSSPSPKLINDNVRTSAIIKRDNISHMVTECCKRACSIDDFRNICGKK
ncbi:Hypothetical protein CINCED_3A022817 [Cinara cedri]|nr:Hypothetical protein CINCED_3A022817 [Cinara cedri]